jgi:hypothetical protein
MIKDDQYWDSDKISPDGYFQMVLGEVGLGVGSP